MKAILDRRSIRKYTNEKVSDRDVRMLLMAAMEAPSAGNEQPWEFILVTDKNIMARIMEFQPHSKMLKKAPLAIVICGNTENVVENKKLRKKYKGVFWYLDCAAAVENILIEAQYLGLGAVWLGIYPIKDWINGIKELFNLPDQIIPFAVVSVGQPAEKKKSGNRYNDKKIHLNKW